MAVVAVVVVIVVVVMVVVMAVAVVVIASFGNGTRSPIARTTRESDPQQRIEQAGVAGNAEQRPGSNDSRRRRDGARGRGPEFAEIGRAREGVHR